MAEVTRTFRQIKPERRSGQAQPTGVIEDFFENHVFVVLGEPGLGKTTSFQYGAHQEPGAVFIRIGEFLSAPKLDHLAQKTLYLDGLDEHRSRANGVDVMDAIIGRVKSLGNPKVRISCRTAEWHGGKDLDALSSISDGTPVVQLELQPLTEEDISLLASDLEDFVSGAQQHDLGEFLANPQDFELLKTFYRERNKWPDSRTELMEGACNALLKELNEGHYKALDDVISDRTLGKASDYLACILMLSNVAGIARDRLHASKVFPAIHEFYGDLQALRAATGRRVFKIAEEERIEPKHRKIAEYMAARFLAASVREGLSLSRVMALMTGIDGGTPPDLRGVYAWLVTLLSGMAERVLVHDPYGAIIYGDPRAWTPSTKRASLMALKDLASKDPWFRAHDRSRAALGGLSDESLTGDFEEMLLKDECKSHLVGTVLDIVAGGSPLPSVGNSLLGFLRDNSKPDHLRSQAVDAFATACPDRISDLVAVLDEVNSNDLKDRDSYLRGALLEQLYPDTIGPRRVAHYLVTPTQGVIGQYHLFLRHTIFQKTSNDGLREIAKSIRETSHSLQEEDDFWASMFISGLVKELVVRLGCAASLDELHDWLSLGIGKYGSSRLDRSEADSVRGFFTNHDELYVRLFLHTLEIQRPTENHWHQVWRRFLALVSNASPPNQFPRALLAEVSNDDREKSSLLYELACLIAMDQDPALSSVTMDNLVAVSEDHPWLAEILQRRSRCEIDEWRQEDAARRRDELIERKSRLARNIENLDPHKSGIESGKALAILEHYARIWFGLFVDVDHDVDPMARLCNEVGSELADKIVSGFSRALYEPYFNSISEIAETSLENRAFHRGFLMLAGMDVVAMKGPNAVLKLPDSVLELAVAYEMSNAIDRKLEWPAWIFSNKVEFTARVLDTYWRTQLQAKPERLTGFYSFNRDEPRLPAITKILPGFLSDFPRASVALLESMLCNAILYCTKESIAPLIDNALSTLGRAPDHRTIWMAAGFLFSPTKYHRQLRNRLARRADAKWLARSIVLANIWERDSEGHLLASVEYRKLVVELLGAAFSNVHLEAGGEARWIGPRDAPTVAEEVRRLIHAFGTESSDNVKLALQDLRNNPSLEQWHTDILYARANHLRAAREAKFTYADVSDVVATLANAEPANVADLKALVSDAIAEVGRDIRDGNTDGYKSFWNTNSYGKATNEHIDENTARNRLLEHLRPKLRHLDIVAEPEVRYADEKRADIAIYSRGMKLPIEVKRDDHPQVWTAAEQQLEKQYSRDPASEGNGIYLAFWFDGKGMKIHPGRKCRPKDPIEFREFLRESLPEASAGLIDISVIDVSIPDTKKAKQSTKMKGSAKAKGKPAKAKVAKKKATTKKAVGKKAAKKKAVDKKGPTRKGAKKAGKKRR